MDVASEGTGGEDSRSVGSAQSMGGGNELQILADVASTMCQPAKQSENLKLTKRNVQTMDKLNVTQIKNLTDKLLVNMFSEPSANEMKKLFSYTCFMRPDCCTAFFTVYGNEQKARNQMLEHLHAHIEELEVESKNEANEEFTAEPMHARKKRLAADKAMDRKLKKVVVAGGPKARGKPAKRSPTTSKYTSLLPKAGVAIIADASNAALFPPMSKLPKARKQAIVRHFANKKVGIRLPDQTEGGHQKWAAVSSAGTASQAAVSQAPTASQILVPVPMHTIEALKKIQATEATTTQATASATQATAHSTPTGVWSNSKHVVQTQVESEVIATPEAGSDSFVTAAASSSTGSAAAVVERTNSISMSTPSATETTTSRDVRNLTILLEHNQALLQEQLNRSQPWKDHCYTTINGKKPGIENQEVDSDKEDEEEEVGTSEVSMQKLYTPMQQDYTPMQQAVATNPIKSVLVKVADGQVCANHGTIPVVRMARVPRWEEQQMTREQKDQILLQAAMNVNTNYISTNNPAQQTNPPRFVQMPQPITMKHAENFQIPQHLAIGPGRQNQQQQGDQTMVFESTDEATDAAGQLKMHGQRPYPPMPKSDMALQGRMYLREELAPEADQGDKPKFLGRKAKNKAAQWEAERKLAVKCIREIRMRKGYKEDGMLSCRICKNKTFTANATLLYHYRSHAGIKPFICLICNADFTRQHSLNYHMLIHNNQSRFTCKDCGRKFRHPSHFKEHLRRHTGETPFHCADCPLRFKTRNTYKRHLMTRHNKKLTANGISVMQAGEFGQGNVSNVRGAAAAAAAAAVAAVVAEAEKEHSDNSSVQSEKQDEGSIMGEDTDDVEEDDEEITLEDVLASRRYHQQQQAHSSSSMPAAAAGAASSSSSSSASVPSTSRGPAAAATPSPQTPAATTLLQFCHQVAYQMEKCLPPSSQ